MLNFQRNDDGAYTISNQIQLQRAMKKPIPVYVCQMAESFQVETLEGIMTGKAGDWLMIDVNGKVYPCADDVFKKSYDLI